jgi:hypothetical protein
MKKTHYRDPSTNTKKDYDFLNELEKYFESSQGTLAEKLQNFTKFTPRQDMTNLLARFEIFKKVHEVQGSVIECGVRLGGGLFSWAHFSSILEPVNYQRKIIGFDTFTGFPSISKKDEKSISKFAKKGGYASNAYEDLQNCVKLYDTNRFIEHIPKIQLVKGDAVKTIPKFVKDNPHLVISLLNLDFDLFEPTKVAIENLVPRMPKGSIIVFDEINNESWPGETLAVLETLGINNLRIQRIGFDDVKSYAILE